MFFYKFNKMKGNVSSSHCVEDAFWRGNLLWMFGNTADMCERWWVWWFSRLPFVSGSVFGDRWWLNTRNSYILIFWTPFKRLLTFKRCHVEFISVCRAFKAPTCCRSSIQIKSIAPDSDSAAEKERKSSPKPSVGMFFQDSANRPGSPVAPGQPPRSLPSEKATRRRCLLLLFFSLFSNCCWCQTHTSNFRKKKWKMQHRHFQELLDCTPIIKATVINIHHFFSLSFPLVVLSCKCLLLHLAFPRSVDWGLFIIVKLRRLRGATRSRFLSAERRAFRFPL